MRRWRWQLATRQWGSRDFADMSWLHLPRLMLWHVADDLGWAKTYDAQYVALAQVLACKLGSVDERLLRGVARLDIAVRPRDL
jgi:predicted nucleic acid-binding protein